jgi:hypothetical protein
MSITKPRHKLPAAAASYFISIDIGVLGKDSAEGFPSAEMAYSAGWEWLGVFR